MEESLLLDAPCVMGYEGGKREMNVFYEKAEKKKVERPRLGDFNPLNIVRSLSSGDLYMIIHTDPTYQTQYLCVAVRSNLEVYLDKGRDDFEKVRFDLLIYNDWD